MYPFMASEFFAKAGLFQAERKVRGAPGGDWPPQGWDEAA